MADTERTRTGIGNGLLAVLVLVVILLVAFFIVQDRQGGSDRGVDIDVNVPAPSTGAEGGGSAAPSGGAQDGGGAARPQ